jgi:hypothetical protein
MVGMMNKYLIKVAEIRAKNKKARSKDGVVGKVKPTKKNSKVRNMDSLKNQFFVPKAPKKKKKAWE